MLSFSLGRWLLGMDNLRQNLLIVFCTSRNAGTQEIKCILALMRKKNFNKHEEFKIANIKVKKFIVDSY